MPMILIWVILGRWKVLWKWCIRRVDVESQKRANGRHGREKDSDDDERRIQYFGTQEVKWGQEARYCYWSEGWIVRSTTLLQSSFDINCYFNYYEYDFVIHFDGRTSTPTTNLANLFLAPIAVLALPFKWYAYINRWYKIILKSPPLNLLMQATSIFGNNVQTATVVKLFFCTE